MLLHTTPVPSAAAYRAAYGGHHLAVAASILYGYVELTPATAAAVAWLRPLTPVARTGQFFIFDLRQ